MKKVFLTLTLLYSILNASNLDHNSSVTLFSINDINYTKDIFPKEFETFSIKLQKRFAAKYVFYKLLLDNLKDKQQQYAREITTNIKKEEEKQKRIGEVLSPFKKMFFKKKIIVDTIAYNELLKEEINIDKEAETFYKKNKTGFFYPKRVELSVIILNKKTVAEKIIKEIDKNDIESFSIFAKKYSKDSSGKHGGYIGLIIEKNTDNFEIYYNSKENSLIPKVLKSKNKYIIAYLFKKYKAEQMDFLSLKEDIKKNLLKKKIKLWKSKLFKKLKSNVVLKHNF